MRRLREYILDEFAHPDIIDKQLYNHFRIFCLFEPHNIYEGHMVFEGSGIFKGCSKVIDKIVRDVFDEQNKIDVIIKTRYSYSYSDFHITEHFFDKLVIVLHDEDNDDHQSYYDYDDDDWDGEKLSYAEIHIYSICDIDVNDFAGLLTHELTHVHDNYLVHKILNDGTDITTDNDIKVDELSKTLKCLQKELKKDKDNISLQNKIDDVNLAKNAYYYLDKYEINAFISQLSALIKRDTFENSSEYLYKVRNLSVYKMYKKLYEESLKPNNIFSKLNIDKKDIKMFKKEAQRVWKKLINHTYLAYIEQVEEMIKENMKKSGKKRKVDYLYCFESDVPVWKRLRN